MDRSAEGLTSLGALLFVTREGDLEEYRATLRLLLARVHVALALDEMDKDFSKEGQSVFPAEKT